MSNEYDLHGHAEMRQKEFMDKHKLGSIKSRAEKSIKGPKHLDDDKKIDNPDYKESDIYHKAQAHSKIINNEVRDKLHKGYSEMAKSNHEELKHHLLSTYIKGNAEHSLPYTKVHGTGGNDKPASAAASDPSDNDTYHKIRNAKKLSFHKGGEANINVHAHETDHPDDKGKKVFSLQVKHNNGPLTNLKIGAV
jgi:hypothetical protein